MNKILKMSMLAALTMSSASVFAAAGDSVTGGQGSVTVDGTVQTNTCAVAVDKTSLTAKILKADLDASSGGVDLPVIGDTTSTFTLSNCNAQPIKVVIKPTSGNSVTDMIPYWSITGTAQIGVRLATPAGTISGGSLASINSGNPWTSVVNYTNANIATNGIKLIPSADTTTFPVTAFFAKRGSAAYSGPSSFTTGYTYNLTYL